MGKKDKQVAVKKTENVGDETWGGKFDFFLSALGYAVGLGNVWRFPYLCYRNGGGVFFIPYLLFMLLAGIPLVFIEMSTGQFTSKGPMGCWTPVPAFRGIGLSMNIVNLYYNIYYNMIIAYGLYYLVLSLNTVLPWVKCNPAWASASCVDDYSKENFQYTDCDQAGQLKCLNNGQCFSSEAIDGSAASCEMNSTLLNQIGYHKPTFPTQDYYNNVVLKISSGIEETGSLVWQLLLALFCAWLLIWTMVVKGIKVSGKVVYFTAIFPYIVLLVLGIRGWLLPGALKGIEFYVKPDFSKLLEVSVWSDAATQIFFSLSIAYGGLTTLASFNKFENNIMRDAITITMANCTTSIFAGFVIFSYLGYLAETTGQSVDQVVQQGTGLAFIVYPYAVTTIPGGPIWAIMFFFMIVLLGMDSMMASVETTVSFFTVAFPQLLKTERRKQATTTAVCLGLFLLGLTMCFQSGNYWLSWMDTYAGGWAILVVGGLESIAFGWFYGLDNFKKDVTIMVGKKYTNNIFFTVYWRFCWMFVIPVFISVLVFFVLYNTKVMTLNGYVYPVWSLVLGQLMGASVLVGFFGWAIWSCVDARQRNKPLKSVFKPDFERWRPRDAENLRKRDIAHGFITDSNLEDMGYGVKVSGQGGIDNQSYRF